ncbi:MAG TPA: tetratricopeptide repeat protein [Methanospirillum sp.]|uniref:tetratricopeptide repeat protein n=1 Tax=Methanospirillum sp. TaxID=45200 RepID=UPI002C8A6013|nr:tetratricopeptide repeat protein [Methanospirillum sp.]HWQ63269.1 tetratricopeptide repeat protein [Methanospirillum sp.]
MISRLLFIAVLVFTLITPVLIQAAVDPLSQADDAYNNGEYQRAIRWYDEALSANPNDQDVVIGRLRSLAALSRWDEVVNGASRFNLTSADTGEVSVLRAEAAVKTGNPKEALNILDNTIDLNRTEEVRIRSAALIALDRSEEAASLIRNMENEGPLDPRLSLLMGTILIEKGNISASLPYLEEAYLALPNDPDASTYLGDVATSLGKYEEALDFASSAAALNQSDPSAWVNIAYLNSRLGRYDEAIDALEHPLAVTPDDPQLLNAKAYALYLSGRGSEGRTLAEEVLRQHPGNPGAKDTLGCILLSEGKVQEATEYLEQAVEYLPRDPEVLSHLADAYHQQGMDNKAEDLYQRSLRIDGSSGRAWKGYSEVLISLERFPEAASAIAEAFKYYPGDSKLIAWEEKADKVLVDWYLKEEAANTTTSHE